MRLILFSLLLFYSLALPAETRIDLPEREGGHVVVTYSLPIDGAKIKESGQWVTFAWVNSNPEAPVKDVLWENGEKFMVRSGVAADFRYTHYDTYHCRAIATFATRKVVYDFDVTIQKPEPVKAEIPRQ